MEEAWRSYAAELGIQEVIDYLEGIGKPTGWVTRIPDISQASVFFLPEGKPGYRSECPCYEGYWLSGCESAVKCRNIEELLPGIVWYKTCGKGHENCPLYRKE